MKKCAVLILAFIMLSALFLTSCDPKGSLSAVETETLYAEIKELFTSGEIFNYRAKPRQEANAIDKPVKESDIEFIRSLSEQIFDEENQLLRYGLWWNSKRKCKILVITCTLTMQYDGNNCIVEEFCAANYNDEAVTVTIYCRPDGADGSDSREVVYVRFEPDQ